MTGIFAAATAVQRRSSAVTGDGETTDTYAAVIHPGWDIGGNANGGYLLALAGRAMADAVGRPPVSLTAHYLRPASSTGACEVVVTTVRAGRRFSTATASLVIVDDGGERRELIRLLGTFGEQTFGGPSYVAEEPVDLPDYDDCELPPSPSEGPKPAMMERLASRIFPGDEGFRTGNPTGEAQIRGWFAFADHEPIDAIGLLLVADAFPPPVFNTDLPVGWVPTVELTVHVRGVPAPGPLRCRFRSRFVHDGLLDEDGEMWDSAGTLVAQSRQLALAPRPPA
ncbi:MAG TPA: thioesterase family protein [Ilumatobacteraceae bacterium]|nr:thioesterase family protein [Ilumatobacteraceae bacterium]